MNAVERLEFELAYFETAVQLFSRYTKSTLHWFVSLYLILFIIYLFIDPSEYIYLSILKVLYLYMTCLVGVHVDANVSIAGFEDLIASISTSSCNMYLLIIVKVKTSHMYLSYICMPRAFMVSRLLLEGNVLVDSSSNPGQSSWHFTFVMIPSGILLFTFQLWVNSRADLDLLPS